MAALKVAEPVIVHSPVNQASTRDSTALDGRSIGSGIFQFREARASQQTLVDDEAPLPRGFAVERDEQKQPVARASNPCHRELAFRSREPAIAPTAPVQGQWSVYCNNCDVAMYDAHYHCSICDGGDYDLCEACIANGILCPGESHWLIKRSIKDGQVVTSTTERIGGKYQKESEREVPGAFTEETKTLAEEHRMPTRTCNNCVYVLPEAQFVTCTTCDDFDLCITCHTSNKHGHHPAHGFKPATDETVLTMAAEAALAPGRHVRHNALCDGCDKPIYGVRHKCLDCPDWDYCSTCIQQASLKHARHRFTAIFSPIAEPRPNFIRHLGIYCDGPLCKNRADQSFITGVRYKCAVCHDTDFCASCEALPGNHHNRTHPLIKFKTPVRGVTINTMNEDVRGHVRNMGDRVPAPVSSPIPAVNAASEVHTVAEFKPEMKEKTMPIPVFKSEPSTPKEPVVEAKVPASLLSASFVKDSIADGTVVAPGARFTQIWTLKNDGLYPWPAGCSVRYVGGDNMLNIDNDHPASVSDIANASESNVVGREVQVGEEIAFKLTLKAPAREGKAISYWRVKAADGTPFGHRLWCDVEVKKADESKSTPLTGNETMANMTPQQWNAHNLQSMMIDQQMAAMPAMQAQRSMLHQASPQQTHTHPVSGREIPVGGFTQYRAPPVPHGHPMDASAVKDKETAKLRVEAIKAKLLKARAEKHNHAVAEAKAARAAAEKKTADENAKVKKIIEAVTKSPAEEAEDVATSQMVFPKLEKESPDASIIQSSSSSGKGKAAYVEDEAVEEAAAATVPVQSAPSVISPQTVAAGDDFDDLSDLDILSQSEDDGFMTDEEYDILDASDQETVASK